MRFSSLRGTTAALLFLVSGTAYAAESSGIGLDLWWSIKKLAIALGLLFGGWLLANVVRKALYALLCRTTIDNKIARVFGLDLVFQSKEGKPLTETRAVERMISTVVYWLLLLFTLIAALDALGLSETLSPIRSFMETVMKALPLVGKAALILGLAWLAGLGLGKLITFTLGKLDLDGRLAKASGDTEARSGRTLAESAGTLVFWLCMLIGVAGAVEALQIEAFAQPLRGVLNDVLGVLPKLAVAAAIGLGGWILARIARALVQNLTSNLGVDGLPGRVGLGSVFEARPLSWVLGVAVMVFILAHTFIAAFDQLGLKTLSQPLSSTVDQFWIMLPAILMALLFLALGIFLGRTLNKVVTNVLRSIGFDRWLARMGIDLARLRGEEGEREDEKRSLARIDTPSELVGALVQLVVVLVALVEVFDNLRLHAWGQMVRSLLGATLINGVLALIIVGVGLALGHWVRSLIVARAPQGDAKAAWMGGAARIAVLVFAFTMGLAQLGLATPFVLLAFGLVFGALCLALALAFGLGSREVAAQIVQKQYDKQLDEPSKPAKAKK